MHEMALAQNIVATIGQQVTDDFKKVAVINLEVGNFSGVVAESLDFGLKMAMEEKSNREVAINIRRVPTVVRCECGEQYQIEDIFESCPACRSLDRQMLSGTDVVIDSVEIADDL